jgi:hypothetical protein
MKKFTLMLFVVLSAYVSNAQNLNAFGTSGARFLRITYNDDPSTTAVIGWDQVSGTNGSGVVHYGTSPGVYTHTKSVDRTITYRSMNNNFARLTGLTPKTNYYFKIVDSQGQTTEFWFTTQSNDPNDRLAVIAGGDSRNNRTPRRGGNNIVDKLNPHMVWFGGDMIDTDNDAQWVEWFADWTETYNDDNKIIPIVAARGNHESANSIFNLFDIPSSAEYYALSFNGNLMRFYTLNSEASVTTQGPWLEADLKGNCDVFWKAAQYHRPIIPHEPGKTDRQAQYDNWAHHFFNYGVKLVVDSDAHVLKSTYPLEPTTWGDNAGIADKGYKRNDEDGTVFIGEGCWGAPTRGTESFKWTRDHLGYFNHVNWVFISKTEIEVRTIAIDQVASVGTTSYSNIFDVTKLGGSSLYVPSNGSGSVITISPSSKPSAEVLAPADGTTYSSPQAITIEASASTFSGTITQVEFFVNGVSIGTDNTAPYSISYTPPADGVYELKAVATNSSGKTSLACYTSSITVGNPAVTVQIPVAVSSDDAEERISNGAMSLTSSDLEIVTDGTTHQTVGVRFSSVNVPKNAIINYAYIQFECDETGNANLSGQTTSSFTVFAHDVGNSGTFTTTAYNISSRAKSATSVSWNNVPNWSVVGERGVNQRTADLTSLVNLLLARTDWSQGNPMTFIITGSSGTRRVAEAIDGTAAPILVINYSMPATPLAASSIITFNGKKSDKTSVLDWTVDCTTNKCNITIERSNDNTNFTVIDEVKTKSKGRYIDYNPQPGVNYYRITYGNTTSRVIAVEHKGTNVVNNVYPIPTSNGTPIMVKLNEKIDNISLVDATGRNIPVTIEKLSDLSYKIITDNLSVGGYIVVIKKGDKTEVRKVFIN